MKDTFYDHLEIIEEHNSTIDKENLLIAFLKEEPYAEEFLRLTFNDDVYGLAEKSFYNAYPELTDTEQYEHVSDFLFFQTFEENMTGINDSPDMKGIYDIVGFVQEKSGSNLLQYLRQRFFVMSKLDRKWISRLLLKDLRCGVQRKTVNKAFKALGLPLIEKFSLQLCEKIDVYNNDDVRKFLKFPVAMECKYDGIRLQAEVFEFKGIKKVKLTSRRGKDRTEDYPEIVETLLERVPPGIILDGEIISRSFQSLTRKDDTSKKKYIVFDMLIDERMPYKDRYDNLRNLFSALGLVLLGYRSEEDTRFTYTYSTNIELAEHYSADTIEDVRTYYEQLNERGEEGIVIKNYNCPYERGSRKYMFKCKKVYTADLRIYDYKLGEGKRTGMVSTLCLSDKFGKVKVDVGSGIDDNTSQELTRIVNEHAEAGYLGVSFIGSICEIKYNEITETGSIRFPRFVCIRDDKDEADDLSNIKVRQEED